MTLKLESADKSDSMSLGLRRLQETGVSTLLNEEAISELDADVAEILGELEAEEEAAEEQDLREDAELDAEGFVDGTAPVNENDEGELRIQTEIPAPGQTVPSNSDLNDLNEWREGTEEHDQEFFDAANGEAAIDPNVQHWNDLEEWREVTDEHDKAFFKDYNAAEGGVVQPDQASDWNYLKEWHEVTDEHDEAFFKEYRASHGQPDEVTDAPVEMHHMTPTPPDPNAPPPTPAPWNGLPPSAFPPEDGEPTGAKDQATPTFPDNSGLPPTPAPTWGLPPSAFPPEDAPVNRIPIFSPTTGPVEWNDPAPVFSLPTSAPVECEGIAGQVSCAADQYALAIYAFLALIPILLICCCRRYCCSSSSAKDTRGEYRAVAAQYGDMGYDNTFSEVYSDDEDEYVGGDVEDDSWGKSGRRTLEMSNLGSNGGGLSLEEMNG